MTCPPSAGRGSHEPWLSRMSEAVPSPVPAPIMPMGPAGRGPGASSTQWALEPASVRHAQASAVKSLIIRQERMPYRSPASVRSTSRGALVSRAFSGSATGPAMPTTNASAVRGCRSKAVPQALMSAPVSGSSAVLRLPMRCRERIPLSSVNPAKRQLVPPRSTAIMYGMGPPFGIAVATPKHKGKYAS